MNPQDNLAIAMMIGKDLGVERDMRRDLTERLDSIGRPLPCYCRAGRGPRDKVGDYHFHSPGGMQAMTVPFRPGKTKRDKHA